MLVFFDLPATHEQFFPLTFTRPLAELRLGILTLREKWEKRLQLPDASYLTVSWLTEMYPFRKQPSGYLYINGSVSPSLALAEIVRQLPPESSLVDADQTVIALRTTKTFDEPIELVDYVFEASDVQFFEEKYTQLSCPADIFLNNRDELIADFELITAGRKSAPINDPHTAVYGYEQVFLEEGAKVRAAVLNGESGPIYIGRNAEVHEGCTVRGAFALNENAVLNMGAKIKGDTTIGPFCKVGGEVSNSVLMGYSNKGHEGFLGNSVLGEWCNLGADTNVSNLKNNYSSIKVWDYARQDFRQTELIFHGLVMGDHAKCGINTMFNTGTMVGVGANVFGGGFPPKFVPSFSWGGSIGLKTFELEKFFDMANRMMQRRDKVLTAAHRRMLTAVYESTQRYRG